MKPFGELISDEFRINWYDSLLIFTLILIVGMLYHMLVQMPELEAKYQINIKEVEE